MVSRKCSLLKSGLYGNVAVRKTEYTCLAKLGSDEMTFGPDISAEISGKGEVDYGAVKVVEIMGISESEKIPQYILIFQS